MRPQRTRHTTHLGVAQQQLVDVGAAELGQLAVLGEHNDGDVAVGEHGELVGLLHEAGLALEVRDRAVAVLGDALDLDLLAAHLEVGEA
jgi:hypothetical protein